MSGETWAACALVLATACLVAGAALLEPAAGLLTFGLILGTVAVGYIRGDA